MRVVSSWSWVWLVLERSRPTRTSAMMARTGPASRARAARTMGRSIYGELPALDHREMSRTSLPNQTADAQMCTRSSRKCLGRYGETCPEEQVFHSRYSETAAKPYAQRQMK